MRFWRTVGLFLAPFPIPAFYRDVARNWGGIGLIYVFMLFTLAWIPSLVKLHLSANKFAQEDFPKFANKLPDFSVKNGKISSEVEQPFEINDERGNLIFVLDTTGKINNLEQTKALFLLTDTKFHQRDPNNGQIQIHDLAQMQLGDFDFTAEKLQSWVDTACTWLAVGLYPFVMLGSLIRALIIMLIASIVGLICNAISGKNVSYGGLLRLAAVGLTTSVYIDVGMDVARWAELTTFQIPFWFFIATGITCVYVAFGTFVAGPPVRDDRDRDYDDDRDNDRTRRPHRDRDGDYEEDRGDARPRRRREGEGDRSGDDGGFKEGTP